MAAPHSPPRLLPSGDSAITVEFSRTIDDAANRRVLALDRALAAEPIAGVTETVPTYRSLLVHYDPVQIGFDDARREAAGARAAADRRRNQGPALAHSRRLWRRARHRPRGRRQNAQHHARRYRGAAHRRPLSRRHDRLYAGLVLSQRACGLPAYAAAAEPAAADAGRHDFDRRRADRRAMPRRPERLASARTDRGPHLPAASRSDLPAGARRPDHALRPSMPRPSPSRIAPPRPANSSPS